MQLHSILIRPFAPDRKRRRVNIVPSEIEILTARTMLSGEILQELGSELLEETDGAEVNPDNDSSLVTDFVEETDESAMPETPIPTESEPVIEEDELFPDDPLIIGKGGGGGDPGDPMPDWRTIGNGFPTTQPPVNHVRGIIGTRANFHSFVIVQTTNDQFFFYSGTDINGVLAARRGIYGNVSNPAAGPGNPSIDHEVEPFRLANKYVVVGNYDDDIIADLNAAVDRVNALGNQYTASGRDNCHGTATAVLRSAGIDPPATPYPADNTGGVTIGWGQLPTGFTIP